MDDNMNYTNHDDDQAPDNEENTENDPEEFIIVMMRKFQKIIRKTTGLIAAFTAGNLSISISH
jgi:hypothetical protein